MRHIRMRYSHLLKSIAYLTAIGVTTTGVFLVGSFVMANGTMASPPPPRLIAPTQGLAVPYYAVRLTAENALDIGNYPVPFDFQIFADSTLTEMLRTSEGVPSSSSIARSPEFNGLQKGRRYWWRARSHNVQGPSEWSQAEHFTTRDAQVRLVPATQEGIGGGIVHSWDGDTVLVGPGSAELWNGIQIFDFRVVVKSQHGPHATFLVNVNEGKMVRIGDVTRGAPGHGAVFEGFTIDSHRGEGIFSDRADYDVINCVFDTTVGAAVSSVRSRLTISRCDFQPGTEETGIYLFQSDLQAHHNLFWGGTAQPLIFVQESSARVWNNTFVSSFTGVGSVSNAFPVECINNIFFDLRNYSIVGSLATAVDEDYNLFYQNFQNTVGEIQSGGHSIFADPMFSDAEAGLYTLRSSSPAIDAGDPDSLYRESDGSRSDIGAFGVWEPPQLIGPLDETVRTLYPLFEWIAIPLNQITYTLVVSEDSVFRTSEARTVSSTWLQWPTALKRGTRYHWRVHAYSITGTRYQSEVGSFVTNPSLPVPVDYALLQNYPNPFNSQTVIPVDLPEESQWSISIHNVLGQTVWGTSGQDAAGRILIPWDGRTLTGEDAASGIYLVRAKIGRFDQTRKMTLIR